MITERVSQQIYDTLLSRYKGDRVKTMHGHEEIVKYLDTYSQHINDVPASKATNAYCIGETCFDTISRRNLTASIYPFITSVLEEHVPTREVRVVLFDILFGCFLYGADLKYSRIHLNNIYREPIEGYKYFTNTPEVWAQAATSTHFSVESNRDCHARNIHLSGAALRDEEELGDTYTGDIDDGGMGTFYQTTVEDFASFIHGVRIRDVYAETE